VAEAPASQIAVCGVDALTDAQIVPVQAGDRQLLIVKDGDRIVACERSCPHEQADLALGRCAHGRLFCPRHYASFDLRDSIAKCAQVGSALPECGAAEHQTFS
jgi:3-phenylpropionate/trans-cinnamate dioxygenase ferredoxin component